MEKKQPMTVREAGRLGGLATKSRQLIKDPEFYQRIGRLGGRKVRATMQQSKATDGNG